MSQQIVLISAISENNVIGKDNDLPWKLKDDLRLFKNITKDHPIIMGRKNYESIGRALPNRLNIIMSRDNDYEAKNCIVVNNLQDALNIVGFNTVFVIGGREIYELAMPRATHFFRTTVHANVDGDVYFPIYNEKDWESCYSTMYLKGDDNQYDFTFELLKRK